MTTEIGTHETTDTVDENKIDDYKEKLIGFFGKFAGLAEKLTGKVFFFLCVSALSACWLTFYVWQLLNLSVITTVIFILLFGLPTFLLLKLYLTLKDVLELPDQIKEMGEGLKEVVTNMKYSSLEQIGEVKEGKKRAKISDIFRMGKFLFSIKGQISDAAALPESIGSALLFASPLFGILVAVSTITTILMVFLSFITGLVFVI